MLFLSKYRMFAKTLAETIMKYPIGIQDFEKIINGGYVYVDKTALIYRLVTEGNIYFLSRPRRFGKSLLISTLEAYFKGKKELFKGLAIDELEKEWAEYPVFHIDFNGENYTKPGKLEEKIIGAVETWEAEYGRDPYKKALGDRFIYVLAQAAKKQAIRCRGVINKDIPMKIPINVFETQFVNYIL